MVLQDIIRLCESNTNMIFIVQNKKTVFINKRAQKCQASLNLKADTCTIVLPQRYEYPLTPPIVIKPFRVYVVEPSIPIFFSVDETVMDELGIPMFIYDTQRQQIVFKNRSYDALIQAQPTHVLKGQFYVDDRPVPTKNMKLSTRFELFHIVVEHVLQNELSNTKLRFTAQIAHEIRTPLNGLLGMMDLMSDTPLTESQTEFLDIMREAGVNLTAIVNDILDYAKLDAKGMTLCLKKASIREIIEQAVDVIMAKAAKNNIDVSFCIGTLCPPYLLLDAPRCKQVLVNLLSNSVKFTERGGQIRVNVNATPKCSNSNDLYEIVIKVTDTGRGIQPDQIPRLFKSFSRIEHTDKSYEGTGLGLVICKNIMDLFQNGAVYLESSDPGHQTVFVMSFEAQETDIDIETDLSCLKGEYALVVDDHPVNRMSLLSTLAKWGMIPIVCAGAEEAMLYVSKKNVSFAIAYLDHFLNGNQRGGLDLAERIKQQKPSLPLVCMSSLGQKTCCTYDACLTKPVKEAKLLSVTLSFLSRNPTTIKPIITQQNGTKIIIAEDIYMNQKVLINMLRKLEYEHIDVVENGRELLQALEKKEYDVILLDIRMPVMDGLDAFAEIKKRPHRPKVVAVTAAVSPRDCDKYKSDGFDAVIAKPIDIKLLDVTLQQMKKKIC